MSTKTKMNVGSYDGTNGHMSFEVALDVMKRGGHVRRASWGDEAAELWIHAGHLVARLPNKEPVTIGGIDDSAVLADDWIEVVEPGASS